MPELVSHIRPITDADIDACVAICAANHPAYIGLHEIEEPREFLVETPYAPAPYYVVEVEGALPVLDCLRDHSLFEIDIPEVLADG